MDRTKEYSDLNWDPKLEYKDWIPNIIEHFEDVQIYGQRTFSWYRSITGLDGVKYINDVIKPKGVLDVGCAFNNFKGLINNHVGIDLIDYNNVAKEAKATMGWAGPDIITDVYDFDHKDMFDMIYCVGPLNFGNEVQICNLLQRFKDIVGNKSGSTMFGHVRPGQWMDHERNHIEGTPHYPWTASELERIAEVMNLEVVNIDIENTMVDKMSEKHILEYKRYSNARFKERGHRVGPGDGKNLSLPDSNIDLNIPFFNGGLINDVLNNEYNRRYDKVNYDDSIPNHVKSKLHWEFKVK